MEIPEKNDRRNNCKRTEKFPDSIWKSGIRRRIQQNSEFEDHYLLHFEPEYMVPQVRGRKRRNILL